MSWFRMHHRGDYATVNYLSIVCVQYSISERSRLGSDTLGLLVAI